LSPPKQIVTGYLATAAAKASSSPAVICVYPVGLKNTLASSYLHGRVSIA